MASPLLRAIVGLLVLPFQHFRRHDEAEGRKSGSNHDGSFQGVILTARLRVYFRLRRKLKRPRRAVEFEQWGTDAAAECNMAAGELNK